LSAIVIGCSGAPPRAPNNPEPAVPSPTAPQPSTPLPELQRPTSDTDEPVPSAAYPIFITQREILVGSEARSALSLPPAEQRARSGVGAEKKDAENGAYIVPLARALAARSCDADGRVQPIGVIHIDRAMQYRVLIETIYTLSKLGYEQLFIATRAGPSADGRPGFRGVRLRLRKTAEFKIVVRERGLWLTDQAHTEFGRDCRALSPQPAPDSPSSGLTLSELQRCVDSLLGEDGALHLAPEGGIPVQSVMPLLHAFGTKRAVTPAFPTVALGAGALAPPLPPGSYVLRPQPGGPAQVVEGLRERFRACYQEELLARGDAAGHIDLKLRVDAKGAVSSVAADVTGNLQTTGECVRAVARAAQFQPPEGGSAIIAVPVTFVKNNTPALPKLPCVAPRPL